MTTRPGDSEGALSPGSHLGPYEILGLLGAGGMGEVYRAHDPRLEREVAVKVLPEPVASDPRRLHFFEREARSAAALNHPNILDVHDIGSHGDTHYVVFELLDGRTLRDRLRSEGRLPVRKVLDVAVQITRGLAAAHEKGIVHRDLKPENLFLTTDGRVKILDFGLARREPLAAETPVDSDHRTATQDTTPGAVVGTPGYMSPEQVRGEIADYRSDIFSFGSVLYEMLSGRSAFRRPTAAETQAAILHEDVPELSSADSPVPPAVDHVLHRCLEKRREDRFQSTRDLGFALEALSPMPDATSARWTTVASREGRRLRWTLSATTVLVATVAALWWWGRRPAPLPAWTPRQITSDPGWEAEPAPSPDGSLIAFSSDRSGNSDIWIVDSRGGAPLRLTDDPAEDRSPAWFPDGSTIAFVSDRGGDDAVWKVPKLGGPAVLVLPHAQDPAPSPRGRRIAFSRLSSVGQLRIWVADLDDTSRATVLTGDDGGLWHHREPAWSPDGRTLCYADQRNLWTVPSEGGPPRPLTHEEGADRHPAWSPDGRHIYFSSNRDNVQALWRIAADGTGAVRLTAGTGPEADLSLSSDGRCLAYSSSAVKFDIVILDLASGESTELGGMRSEIGPGFAPDRTRMVFSSDRNGDFDIWIQPLEDGRPRGSPYRLTDQAGNEMLPTFSPDGRWVAYSRILGDRRDVWVTGSGGGSSRSFTDHPAVDIHPAWSPDGAFLAFSSNRGGQHHVWVAPVANGEPAGPARELTSGEVTDMFPVWSPDGTEIAFRRGDGEDRDVWIVPSEGGAAPRQLTHGAGALQVRWEPGGQALLVSGTWGEPAVTPRRVAADTGEARPLGPPVVMGDAEAVGVFDISADGDLLAYVRETRSGDIWMLEASRGRF